LSICRYDNIHSDLALVRLKEKIAFSAWVQPICLPGEDVKLDEGRQVVVAGW
jgi:hypothetical protein